MSGKAINECTPVIAYFTLSDTEKAELDSEFGSGFINIEKPIEIRVSYSMKYNISLDFEESVFVKHVINKIEWPKGTKSEALKCKTFTDLVNYSKKLRENIDLTEEQKSVSNKIDQEIKESTNGESVETIVQNKFKSMIPKFLYLSDYSILAYSVQIQKLLSSEKTQLSDSELTARSLLMIAGAENDYLVNPDYEKRKRELENVSNAITQDILTFWTQNPELRVLPDITQKTIQNNNGTTSVVDELKIRIWDQRHQL
jgi:hypothetical protein